MGGHLVVQASGLSIYCNHTDHGRLFHHHDSMAATYIGGQEDLWTGTWWFRRVG